MRVGAVSYTHLDVYKRQEQSTYHCERVARRSLRMAGLPTDSNHENLEFLVLRKYTPEERIAICLLYTSCLQ